MASRPTSGDVELCTISSHTSHEHLFPSFYRRVGGGSTGDGDNRSSNEHTNGKPDAVPSAPTLPVTTIGKEQFHSIHTRTQPIVLPTGAGSDGGRRSSNDLLGDDRVVYPPMAEQQKLGYFSTAALIISKVIGTGIFVKPSVVLANAGGKGVSLGLWLACGLMSLAGYGCKIRAKIYCSYLLTVCNWIGTI
jgi:hypothetical protein